MSDKRYSLNAEEDHLFWQIVPHYNEAEETVAEAVQDTFRADNAQSLQILEIGCGTGLTTEKILKADERISLKAIDIDNETVEQARARLIENKQVSFERADALEYLKRQPDASVDAVLSALVFHNCTAEYRERVFAEIYRTLKKGGIFVNMDKFTQDDETEHQAALKWQLKEFEKFDALDRPDLREKWTKHYIEDENPDFLMREGAYKNILEELGFAQVKKTYRYQMEATYLAQK